MKKAFFSLLGMLAMTVMVHAQTKTQQFEAKNFSKISVGGSYNVILEEGNAEGVSMTGDAEDLERAEVKVENGVLKIGTKKGSWGWSSKGDVEVRVTFKTLCSISSSGSSEIEVKSTLKNESLSIACSGSGKVSAPVEVSSLDISVSGSADISLSGKATKQSISVSGSGDIDAVNMMSNEADISVSGSGNIKVAVSDMLKGHVSGSGDIRYKGQPRQSVKISGSGSISSI